MEECKKGKKIANPSSTKLNMDYSTGELEKRLFATYDRIIKMVSDADVYESDFLFGVGDRILNNPIDLQKRDRERGAQRPSTSAAVQQDDNKRPSRSRSRGFNLNKSSLPSLPQLPEFVNLEKMKKSKSVGNVVELEDLLAEAEQLVEIENFLEKYSLQVLENLDADEFDDGDTEGGGHGHAGHETELEEMKKKIKSKFGVGFEDLTNSIKPMDITKCLLGQKELCDIVGNGNDVGKKDPAEVLVPNSDGEDECKAEISTEIAKVSELSEGSGDQKSNFEGTCTTTTACKNQIGKNAKVLENDDCPIVELNKNEPFIQQIKKCQEAMKNLELKESLLFGKDAEKAFGKSGSKTLIQNKMKKKESNASQSKSKFHLPPLNTTSTFTSTTARNITTSLDKNKKKTKPSEISSGLQVLQGLKKIHKTLPGPAQDQGERPISALKNSVNRLVLEPLAQNKNQNQKDKKGDSKFGLIGMGVSKDKGKLLQKADIEKWKQNYCEMKEKKKSLLSSPQSKSASSIQLKQQLIGVNSSGIVKSIKNPPK